MKVITGIDVDLNPDVNTLTDTIASVASHHFLIHFNFMLKRNTFFTDKIQERTFLWYI